MLLTAALYAGPSPAADRPNPSNRLTRLPLFLDVFQIPNEPIVVESLELDSAAGARGSLYRPKSDEQLPGLVLIADGATPEFFDQTARELGGIGFAVLVVPAARADGVAARIEHTTASVRSAAYRLKQRRDVFAERIGVLGWGPMATCALRAASAESAQAVVLVDFDPSSANDKHLLAGLRHTAVLIVHGKLENRDRLRRLLAGAHIEHRLFELDGAKTGFMDCRSGEAFDTKAADRAWFEIYEFVGKFVEDAAIKPTTAGRRAPSDKLTVSFASIADAMRKANGPAGARTAVASALNEGVRDNREWKTIREQSRVLTDCGQWLLDRSPRKGSVSSWRGQAAAYRDAAGALANAAERSSLSDARSALARLNACCARCHAEHR